MAGWILLAGGCSTPDPRTDQATTVPLQPQAQQLQTGQQQSAAGPTSSDKRFIIAAQLLSVLHVASVRLSNAQEGYLRIQVVVQNMSDTPQHFKYHIDWFDQDGAPLVLGTADFTPWMLMPHEVSIIAATSPALTAADFGIAFAPSIK
jgi:uncharacterized protein YcfL